MSEYRILLLDDDPLIQEAMSLLLQRNGLVSEIASTGMEACELISKEPDKYAVVIVDYHLPDRDGVGIVAKLRQINPGLYIIMFSGEDSRDVLKASMKAGATEFFEKGNDMSLVLEAITGYFHKYVECHAVIEPGTSPCENTRLIQSIGLAGRSDAMAQIARDVAHYRQHRFTVFLLGESGTGKERIAKALHKGSEDKFYAVNCASYRDNTSLLESELFGHEKGAFTGADKTKRGIFEMAIGGTVFLDEIHELSVSGQAKLLRVLQEKKIRRVGGAVEFPVNVRVIAAAKPVIEQKKESGEFLLDLYNRLYVFPIHIPALRERKDDILPLVQHFSDKYCSELGKKVLFLGGTVRKMEAMSWSGNVRELENTVLRLIVTAPEGTVGPEQLNEVELSEEEADLLEPQSLAEFRAQFETQEKHFILKALSENNFNLRGAARSLEVSHTTLHSKVKKYGLNTRVNQGGSPS